MKRLQLALIGQRHFEKHSFNIRESLCMIQRPLRKSVTWSTRVKTQVNLQKELQKGGKVRFHNIRET